MTDITDRQRREVAARLRVDGAAGRVPTTCYGYDLADLIDRPTCRNMQTREGKGGTISFTCSECGVAFDTMGGGYEGQGFYGILPCYCPNCGAEVVA